MKSLNLKGFKTFAERTTLEFDEASGLTAIVGPNGCGKSNIVDSFRFSLGEGNFRELRVNTLPEVIFAGTASRKPLSLAEVTLLFDNGEKKLPVDYLEVEVRRRTYRDGQSEFYINSQPCRLKDIRDLFLDTGLSTESLSIIGQGRVDAILSSRPEERRVIFEEVAGILKYKTRKLEVERKLIVTEQNLLRISDLKVEVGEQLLVLEVQAQKAAEYKEIQGRLRDLELTLLKRQLANLLEKKKLNEQRLSALKEQAKSYEERRQAAQDRKLQLLSKLKALEVEQESKLSQIEEVKQKLEGERASAIIERERARFAEKDRIRELDQEERFISFEILKLTEERLSLEEKRAELKGKLEQWAGQENLPEGELRAVVMDLVQLIKQLNGIALFLEGRTVLNLPSQAEDQVLNLFRAELEKLEQNLAALSDNSQFKEEERNKTRERRQELKSSLPKQESEPAPEESREYQQLAGEKSDLLEKLSKLRSEREGIQQELERLETMPQEKGEGAQELLAEEILQARLEGELSQLSERIQVEYNLSNEELLNLTVEAAGAGRGKVEELKARLRELEPVNLLAIDEYARVKERDAFLSGQHQDLQSAHENLKGLITELDLKAREDFLLTLKIISQNFSEIFATLFEGGQARIEMEPDKDPLEAGIEIVVCPSGRKWLNLSLLSGGERSLTAIAILFACLKTQPCPLCILDEVDAALDDANVGRFAAFLSEYKKRTQILIITHNKRTMEVADTIYGITMEEPGVSKVISMRLEKV